MKKSIKKFFSALLCVVMVFSLFSVTGFADDTDLPVFGVSVSGDIVDEGRISVIIHVENISNLLQASIKVSYDSDSLYLESLTDPADKQYYVGLGSEQDSVIDWGIFFSTPVSGNYQIVAIEFFINNTDNLSITVSTDGWDCDVLPENVTFNLADDNLNNPDSFEPPVIPAEFKYEINNSEVTITRCEPNSYTEIIIPQTIEGYPVKEIAGNAFAHCSQITSVVVPEGVTKIGYSAFMMCSHLKEIDLPDTLVTIEQSAFERCAGLNNVVIPEGVTEIAERTFYECTALENIKLPKNLKSIGDSAFCKTGIRSIDIPSGVTYIGSSAFNSTNLEKIVIPYGVKAIHAYTFKDCKNLSEVSIPQTVELMGSYAFYGSEKMKSITIPASVKDIEYMAVGYNNEMLPINLFTIYGFKDSEAERYASSNWIGFVALDDDSSLYDVNGDGKVTAADARMALRASAKLQGLAGRYFYAADVNKDGKITSADARLILRKAAGLDKN